ncbi:MAG: histidine kinase, partial [Deltaproteobacteria bacterium CG_4_10_14_3_um_filter_60_8]
VFQNLEQVLSRRAKRLLIVEDNAALRQGLVELIGNNDVVTTDVGSGEEALAHLGKEAFDCMILDLGLADMTGFDLLARMRERSLASLPIIIYTGKALTRDEEENLQQYAESIIVKGVKSPERLLAETTLFLHRVEADLPEEKQRMLRMVHNRETMLVDKKIMIVDDDMRNVYALTGLLEGKGIQVVAARDGREGLVRLTENPDIDLILMDIMMPEMDGYATMREIRQQREFAKLPIIALTAKAMRGDRNKCVEAGANDYLPKPIDSEKLLSLLRVWLYR